ncbi:hypothetical protein L228DRAFT_18898 [Xylona heveae TC161]|uniref:Uncharacterized protein n=1 Tax=Xylona heveae (strain CBS 132557 / TC161) TaxID=1328760 RepID=A0A165JYS2_XYLHT|nr:hypothetical protein L228DRAFT_18898 [Xylona heveae TC161]KZF26797.1 hypothetical protein L228DRAFT_18898 [Xylona heveae TC161]
MLLSSTVPLFEKVRYFIPKFSLSSTEHMSRTLGCLVPLMDDYSITLLIVFYGIFSTMWLIEAPEPIESSRLLPGSKSALTCHDLLILTAASKPTVLRSYPLLKLSQKQAVAGRPPQEIFNYKLRQYLDRTSIKLVRK